MYLIVQSTTIFVQTRAFKNDGKTKSYWGLVYIMDQEVVPGRCKSVDWLLNSSRDHFSLHYVKKWQRDHEGQGPQNTISKV